MLNPHKTINCAGTLLSLERPLIMGILNIGPDSFYDGGKYDSEKNILIQAEKMLQEGASIIDIGAMTSKPGAEILDQEIEYKRIELALNALLKEFPKAIFSIDTVHARTAHQAIDSGAHIINDVTGGSFDKKMLATVAAYGNIPFVLMHMKGLPNNMQNNPQYEDVVLEILDFFIDRTTTMVEMGYKDVILDPGFGFGKSIEDNFKILSKMHVFKMLDWPILAGLSRKSMLYKLLEIEASEALNATSIVNFKALEEGASILRVHDVKEAEQAIKIWTQMRAMTH